MGSAVLDVAIGVVFVYVTLSLICSTITEGIARLARLRAAHLRTSLEHLLRDDAGRVAELLTNPLVAPAAHLPPEHVRPRDFAVALFTELAQKGIAGIGDLRHALAAVQDARLRDALTSLVESAAGDVDKALAHVADWFDAAMREVSEWYRRKVQVVNRTVAAVLVLALNADTIMLAHILWHDHALRATVVAAAEGRVREALPPDRSTDERALDVVRRVRAELAPLPIGWDLVGDSQRALRAEAGPLALKVLGMLLTFVAVSLGAPFWFDLLRNLVGLRRAPPSKGA